MNAASVASPFTASLSFGPRTIYERALSVGAVFERQAARTPHAVAVVDEAGSLTYAELDRRSNRLANHLRARGIVAGTSIGVAFERSRDLPISLLAILKAGCAYVPLDPTYPAERIAFIIADAAVRTVIVERICGDDDRYAGVPLIDLSIEAATIESRDDRLDSTAVDATSCAYIMYTSGSTGRAKGVAVAHRGIVRLVRSVDYFSAGPNDTFLALAPAAFDASTFELWGALLNGARLAIPRRGLLSVAEIGAAVRRFDVTTLWLTTSIFARVVESDSPDFAVVRQLLTGGSAGSPHHMIRFLARYPACRLINGYGPTENTTFSTTYHLASEAAIGTNPPIGYALPNSSAHVLDDRLQPVARGIEGNLYVGGDGVAIGYVNSPQDTAARFIPDPFAAEPSARLYRTGDRARMRADGAIEFLGRTDDQIKIHGFRIELGEIEALVRAHPGVRDAAVVAVTDERGEKSLSAHVVATAESALDDAAVRAYLRAKVPAYMVPARIAMCAELPLHPSGKIDRMALARAVAPSDAFTRDSPAVAERGPTLGRPALVRRIGEIWRDILKLDRAPDAQLNFFDAGGDSVRLLELQLQLGARLNSRITVMDLFEYTTIARIADYITAEASA